MSKNNFLLVDLNETKTKKLVETITSDTSRKILNYLTEKEDTETNIAGELKIPISTVHYHLQKLVESRLVIVEEFHYSKKGREINHYKLANKYIIIAPKNVSGLREKLKSILPVAIAILGISVIIKFVSNLGQQSLAKSGVMMQAAMDESFMDAAPMIAEISQEVVKQPDITFWFLAGSVSAILIYLIVELVRGWWKCR